MSIHSDYLAPYRKSHDQHGSGFDVTLWASPQSQRRRFEAFAEMVTLDGRVVLDAGCSRGDFAAWMAEQQIAYGRYIGVDAMCEVLEYASSRGLPRSEFLCADILEDPTVLSREKPQIIAISGTLNTMTPGTARSFLEHAWRATREVLIFNFLSDRCSDLAPEQTLPARRFDTLALLDWAFRRTPRVAFRQDYLPEGHDATIMMVR